MRLKRLITKFLGWCAKARKPKTTEGYRHFLNKFLAEVGNKRINKLRPIDLEKYARTWHEVQSVQRLFQWAKDKLRIIKTNIFAKVPRPPAGQRNRILSPRELAGLLRKTQSPFREFLIGMRETIARPQEIRVLHWEMLQSEIPRLSIEEALAAGRAIFVLHEYKSRERRLDPTMPRVLFVNARLGRLLLRLRALTSEGPVFLNSKGKPWSGNAVRCRMRRLRKQGYLAPDGGRENIVAYSLRHSMATVAVANGVRDKALADLMGHADPETTRRYVHLQIDHLRTAMDRIEDKPGIAARREKRKRKAG